MNQSSTDSESVLNWKGKRVLVTGAGGFIGSHLAERLVQVGAQVRAFVHYNALGVRGWLDSSILAREMEIVSGDICDRDSVRQAMQGEQVVFHLAALIAIPYSYVVPVSYVRTNIEGTLNVLQAAREADVGRVVHTSTSEVYGTARQVPIAESHPLQGQSPYAASKIGADKVAEAFHLSYGVPVVTVRPFNAFGPRQSARAVVPTIVAQCLAGGTVRLGNTAPTRDLNYVSDTVEGFILAAASASAIGRTINIGSGQEISISALAELIARLSGCDAAIQADDARVRPVTSEVMRLVADSTLARTLLGWKPAVGLEEGLSRTIEWIRNHPDGYRHDTYAI
jgi:NAD dependent epimerase/dehydratase